LINFNPFTLGVSKTGGNIPLDVTLDKIETAIRATRDGKSSRLDVKLLIMGYWTRKTKSSKKISVKEPRLNSIVGSVDDIFDHYEVFKTDDHG
jgi:hypothetical protein